MPKNTDRKEATEAAADRPLPMPEYVQDILFEKFGELERELDDLQAKLKKTEEHYEALKKYLFN